MAECEICGKKVMGFSCSYCGGTFCSDHRLPENHNCENLEDEVKKQKKKNVQWFEEKNLKEETSDKKRTVQKKRKPNIIDDIFRSLKNNYVLLIIGITVLSFYLQNITAYEQLLILNPDIFGVTDAPTLLEQPWTLLTVMLLHGGIVHLFVNMLTFYFFGTPVEKILGSKKTLAFYIGSGLVASIAYVVSRNLMYLVHGTEVIGGGYQIFMPAVGASGAVVAFVALVSMLYPRSDVLLFFVIPMKIKTAVYAFGVFEAFNFLTTFAGYPLPIISGFASSAHLAGLLVGIWYGKKLQDKYKRNTSIFDPMQY